MRNYALIILLLLLFVQQGVAQSPQFLQKVDTPVKGLRKPDAPLPDSLKTYGIVNLLDADPALTSISPDKVAAFFQFESFEKKETNADLYIYVVVNAYEQPGEIKHSSDSLGYFYWYQEIVQPQIEVRLETSSGHLLMKQRCGAPSIYKSLIRRDLETVKTEAKYKMNDPSYLFMVRQAHRQALTKCVQAIRDQYDTQTETVSLYYPYEKNMEFLTAISAAKNAFEIINTSGNHQQAQTLAQPAIDFFEQKLVGADYSSKREKYQYYACLMNLANIYRCLSDYDRASEYLLQIIDRNYLQGADFVAKISHEKARLEDYLFYKRTGRKREDTIRTKLQTMQDSMRLMSDSEAQIIFRNDKETSGLLTNFVENFELGSVKLKYEKKLNSPITEADFWVDDIREIRTESWSFIIITYLEAHYLCDIFYESDKLIIYRPLFMAKRGDASKKEMKTQYFVKRGNGARTFYPLLTWEGIAPHMKDCPELAQRIRYKYYASWQIPTLALARYDSLCGRLSPRAVADKRRQTVQKDASSISHRNPGFYIGFSGGSNNFTSFIGVNAAFRIRNRLFARLGTGIGQWGIKYAGGLKYDLPKKLRYHKGWSLAAGYAHIDEWKSPIIVSTTIGPDDKSVDSKIKTYTAKTFSLSAIFNQFFSRKNSFTFEIGYAFRISNSPSSKIIDIGMADPKSLNKQIKLFEPGGLVFGVGINFGL